MAPIRIGFIGLSTSGWASRAHLEFLKQTTKYQLIGICNSSKVSSENAIKHHSLPSSTKAYSSAEELAADPDVDLVVVSVRTDKHGPAVRPALEKGKSAYVEWPLGRNLQEARELADLARKNGSKTIVGLQGRRSDVVRKLKEVVSSGRIGRVLSSTLVVAGGNFGAKDGEALEYFNDPEVGGNIGTIHFGHMIDYVLHILGPLANYSGTVSTQRKQSQIVDAEGKVLRKVDRGTPDQITLQGFLADGGVLSVSLRGGAPFKSTPGLLWRIYGEKGEIQVTGDGFMLQVGTSNLEVKLHDHEKDTVESIDWSDLSHHIDLPTMGQNVAGVYEAFADGKTGDYVDWDNAVKLHELIHNLAESSNSGTRILT